LIFEALIMDFFKKQSVLLVNLILTISIIIAESSSDYTVMLDDIISDTHVSRPFLRKIKSDVINAHILGINHSENILLARDKSCVAKEGASSLEKVFNCYQPLRSRN